MNQTHFSNNGEQLEITFTVPFSLREQSLYDQYKLHEQSLLGNFKLRPIVGVYINTIKTTFPLKFDFEQDI